eukprot:scaffold41942_cov76-Phaeocystis_antarctica.AAC.5
MTHSKVRAQLLGKRQSSAPLCEGYHTRVANPDKPTLALTLALEVALIQAACCSVRHVQRVPAEALLLVGYGLALLGVGDCGRAVRTCRPQPRLRRRGVKEHR